MSQILTEISLYCYYYTTHKTKRLSGLVEHTMSGPPH